MATRRAFLPLALAPLFLATEARSEAPPLRLDLVGPKAIRLDGLPREWPSALAPLDKAIRGSRAPEADLSARAALAYDDTNLYVAFDVTDDRLVRTAACAKTDDHASLLLAFPHASSGPTTHEIALFPGDPGKLPGCVKNAAGNPIAGAKIVEAPKADGYSFEATIPWSAFPEAAKTRVALRGGLRYHDNDGSGIERVVGNHEGDRLLPLPTEPEQSLKEGLLREWSLPDAPAYDVIADITGDGMHERVLVHDKWLVVLGPHFREGKEYFFSDLGASAKNGQIPRFEVRDLTGDGKADIVVEKRAGSPSNYREIVEVIGFGAGDRSVSLFRHEIGITTPEGRIRNEVKLASEGGKPTIEILVGSANGYTVDTYKEPIERSFDSMLFPWGSVKSRRFVWNGQAFVKTNEDSQTPTLKAAAPTPPPQPALASATPRPPTADELQERVYALYRKDRGVSNEKPRFDLAVDVAEDNKRERVLLHGRDLVVFGPDYKGGTGYSFLALQQFADTKDILELQARDLTGDGKAEIIVRGLVHANAGGDGAVIDRELFLVYTAANGQLSRIFGIETARSIGDKRITAQLAFLPGPSGTTIQASPGRVIGWDEKTYPFAQDEGPAGGVEPLLLPWGGKAAVKYRFDGTGFVR